MGLGGPRRLDVVVDQHLLGGVGFGLRLVVEMRAHPLDIERTFPFRDHDGRDAVADQVGERARFRHEAVDPQDQGDRRDRDRADARQRRGQHDEARAGHAGGALRGQQQDADNAELLREAQVGAGRLREEKRRHRQVDAGAIQVERIPGRDHEADDGFLAAEILHLGDHARQHRLGGRCPEHDQQLFLDVADELEDVEARQPGEEAEHEHDEDDAGRIERDHQLGERQERRHAVFADGERHRAERPDRRDLHDDPDHAEQGVRCLVDHVEQRLAALAERLQAEREQDGEEQHLQDLARRERADDRVGNDVHQELDRALLLGFRHEALDRPGVERLDVDVHVAAGLQGVHHDQADDQRNRGQHLEVDQRLEADASDLFHVLHAGDAMHDGAEDDRRDDHLDHLDEGVAERLHLLAEIRIEVPERDTDRDRGEHLHIETVIEWLALGRARRRRCVRHVAPPLRAPALPRLRPRTGAGAQGASLARCSRRSGTGLLEKKGYFVDPPPARTASRASRTSSSARSLN